MTLSDAEKYAARTCDWFEPLGWGSPTDRTKFCPEGVVAYMRGATFRVRTLVDNKCVLVPDDDASRHIAYRAQRDVARWLGFAHTASYLSALESERGMIFKRLAK